MESQKAFPPNLPTYPEAPENEHYPAVETHLIRSRYVAQTFKVQVMQPAQRRSERTRFPVIYVTDGNLAFDVLKGISYSVQRSEHDAPRFIMVGIGYPHESPFAGALLRARDLTFPRYPKLSTQPPTIEGVLRAQPGTKDFHGAEDFQQFIEHELVPYIDERYATAPGERTYFGHSAGGGFGLYTLLTRAELFKNYLISSPGLIYHGRSSAGAHYDNYDFVLQLTRELMATGKALPATKLYMSVGAEEEFEPNLAQWQLTSSFYRLAALLKSAEIPGLELITEVFQGATHMTVWPMAYIHGVQAVFGTGAWRNPRGATGRQLR
jgi:uncharacterized protein